MLPLKTSASREILLAYRTLLLPIFISRVEDYDPAVINPFFNEMLVLATEYFRISQITLAKDIGINPCTMSKWIKGSGSAHLPARIRARTVLLQHLKAQLKG